MITVGTRAALHAGTASGPPGQVLSALKALALLGDRPTDPDAVHAAVTAQADAGTGRWPIGDPSVLATAGGLLCLKELDATTTLSRWLDPALHWMAAQASTREEHFMTIAVADECRAGLPLPRSVAYFRALEQPDGTFGPDPLENGIAASALLRAGETLREPAAVARLLLAAQTPDGGIGADLWTTYCALRALTLLGVAPARERLVPWARSRLNTTDVNGAYQVLEVLTCAVEPVLDAARRGDTATIARHLSAGGDPDLGDPQGWTPLCAAAVHGRSAVVRQLLAAGADPDLRVAAADALPIFWAGQSGDIDTVRALLEARPEHIDAISSVNGHTVLLQAAFFGTAKHRDLAAWLLSHGDPQRLLVACNVRGYTATTMAQLWHNEALTALFTPLDRTTAAERDAYREALLASIAQPPSPTDDLVTAIGAGPTESLLTYVASVIATPGYPVNERGGPLAQTPIIAAVTGVDPDDTTATLRVRLTRLLLSHGADPDLPELHPMAVDAVIRAAVLNHFDCLREIMTFMGPLGFAAALNERPAINGQTALDDTVHRALTAALDSLQSHLDQIRWAIGKGARTDIPDLTGVTVADRALLAVTDPVLSRNAPAVLAALGMSAPVTV